jgi:hypothetical protein
MVTRLLEGDGDPAWKARAVLAGLKAAGWRPTVLAEAVAWRTASGSRSHIPDADRDWVLDRSRQAAARQEEEAKARVKAKATGDPAEGGGR